MYKIEFEESQIEELNELRERHPHHRVRRKAQVLWLKSQGYSHREITKLVGISMVTVRSYLTSYTKGGIEAMKKLKFYKPQSDLMQHKESLAQDFESDPVSTLKEAKQKIQDKTGIVRSIPQVRHFLLSIGLRRLKTGSIPSKADPLAQEDFKKKSWNLAFQRQKRVKELFIS